MAVKDKTVAKAYEIRAVNIALVLWKPKAERKGGK